MNLYLTKNINKDKVAIIHFGIGLIGSAIKNHIEKKVLFKEVITHKFPFKWNDINKYEEYLSSFFSQNDKNLKGVKKIYIIWSAGKVGFQATDEQTKEQFEQFCFVNQILAQNLKKIGIKAQFILLSSAGGLFEGQVAVTKKTPPLPLRPYGKLKLSEENYIKESNLYDEFQILRISSVYSIEVLNKRKGLIQVLMENGLQNKVSYIFGNESTLRDYVLDEDIALFVAKTIFSNQHEELNFIVSGKPSSIYEIRKSIEKVLRRRLYTVFSTEKTNSLNISFLPSVVAANFIPSEYMANITLHYHKLNN